MADKHAYVPSSGPLLQIVNQFRKTFPSTVTSDTLKRLGFATANEAAAINVLRFVGVLDEKGAKTPEAARVFNAHDDAEFQNGFADLVKPSYQDLFELHGDTAWDLDSDKLISYFRNKDGSSDLVGKRQTLTFQAFAVLAGKKSANEKAAPRKVSSGRVKNSAATRNTPNPAGGSDEEKGSQIPLETNPASPLVDKKRDVGLTVRIEINLPAAGDQETYDRIFRSIRENLINDE